MSMLPTATLWPYYVALTIGVLLTTLAQLLLKVGARRRGHVLRSFLNAYTLFGYGLSAMTTILSTFAMQRVDMKVGSTWSAIPYLLVSLLAGRVLREKMSRQRVAGCALIVIGLLLFHCW